MSKMIRVESCGGCEFRRESRVYFYCGKQKIVRDVATEIIIIDPSISLPNCPLEDYKDIESLEDKLDKIKAWCKAYPVTMFPEPDLKKAAKVLKDNGMRLDDISASNMRHVLKGIQNIIEEK